MGSHKEEEEEYMSSNRRVKEVAIESIIRVGEEFHMKLTELGENMELFWKEVNRLTEREVVVVCAGSEETGWSFNK